MSTPSTSEPPPVADQSHWFSKEVHAHESLLKAYVRSSFPRVRDVDDVVQESYLRMWKARAREPIVFARALLFQIARRVALDFLRKERNSPVVTVGTFDGLGVLADSVGVAETVSLQEKVRLLAEALITLPPRAREVVMLCKFQGKLRREVAVELGLSEKTVNEHLWRSLKRIEAHLRGRGVDGCFGL